MASVLKFLFDWCDEYVGYIWFEVNTYLHLCISKLTWIKRSMQNDKIPFCKMLHLSPPLEKH